MSVVSREAAIAEIGVRLLKGHRMMAEACPEGCNCPLMDHQGAIQCVQCLKFFERDAQGELVPAADKAVPAPAPVASVAEDAARPAKRIATPSVGNVGQHLLRGWTMLADHCPRCLSPIMKEPGTNDMWCVECNLKAVNADDFDATIHRAVRNDETVAGAGADSKPAPRPAADTAAIVARAEAVAAAVPPAGGDLGAVRQRLLASLARRLEAACVELEGPSTSADARGTMAQVRDIVATIKDVQLL